MYQYPILVGRRSDPMIDCAFANDANSRRQFGHHAAQKLSIIARLDRSFFVTTWPLLNVSPAINSWWITNPFCFGGVSSTGAATDAAGARAEHNVDAMPAANSRRLEINLLSPCKVPGASQSHQLTVNPYSIR